MSLPDVNVTEPVSLTLPSYAELDSLAPLPYTIYPHTCLASAVAVAEIFDCSDVAAGVSLTASTANTYLVPTVKPETSYEVSFVEPTFLPST